MKSSNLQHLELVVRPPSYLEEVAERQPEQQQRRRTNIWEGIANSYLLTSNREIVKVGLVLQSRRVTRVMRCNMWSVMTSVGSISLQDCL
jgi:hypothetical protein